MTKEGKVGPAGNPVNFVDPDGKRPIYNKYGNLAGVTESGLQGPPLIIPEYKEFVRLSDDEAELMDKGTDGLCDQMAYKRFFDSYTTLDTRPDWDGYITLDEANEWYRSKKLVYGQITVKWYPDNKVRAYDGEYDFSMHPGILYIFRNFFTFCDSIVAGKGLKYNIYFYGTKELD